MKVGYKAEILKKFTQNMYTNINCQTIKYFIEILYPIDFRCYYYLFIYAVRIQIHVRLSNCQLLSQLELLTNCSLSIFKYNKILDWLTI